MEDRGLILKRVSQYRDRQRVFMRFCDQWAHDFPPGNPFGIELRSADPVGAVFSVLDHPVRCRFSIQSYSDEYALGKLVFLRELGRNEDWLLWTVYYDHTGKASESATSRQWMYSLAKTADLQDWLALSLLDRFFASLSVKSDDVVAGDRGIFLLRA